MLPAIVRPTDVINPFSSIASMRYNCFKASSKDSAAIKTTSFEQQYLEFEILFPSNENGEKMKNNNTDTYRKADQENRISEYQYLKGPKILNKEHFQLEKIAVFQELLHQGIHHCKPWKCIVDSTSQGVFFQLALHVD